MDIYSKINETIKNIANRRPLATLIQPAEILSVSGETCSVRIDTLTVNDVRLRSVINGNNEKILTTPKIGSYVLVADLSLGEYRDLAVILFSEVAKINVEIAGFCVEIDQNGVRVENEGENLFTALSDLITEVAKIIVVQGTSPNVPELEQIKLRLNKILK